MSGACFAALLAAHAGDVRLRLAVGGPKEGEAQGVP